jgi:two-component system, NarL family, sensor kinase
MNEMTPESVSARDPPRFRLMMAVAFVAVVALACVVAAALLLWRAAEEHADLRQQSLSDAVALSNALDQEVAAMNYLLKGLSTSPALRAGDYKSFYDQLTATPVPEGSWLILHDLEGQVLNTLRPFGAALPRHSDYPTSPVARVREQGWSVSGRVISLLRPGATLVGLGLRVDSAGQPMKHFLTTIVSDVRLRQIMTELRLPGITHAGAFDRDAQPLFTPSEGSLVSDRAISERLRSRLVGLERARVVESLFDAADERGNPVLVGLRRSALTDWTSVTVTPAAAIRAPFRSALMQLGAALVFLLLVGGLAAHVMTKQVERPINALTTSMTAARQELDALSEQLLVLQEEERGRIARELHDSTAQHLVAGTLGLMQITAAADGNPAVLKACAEVEASLDKGLRELRIFTYLLHPPNLEREGLGATLREFVDGFCRRTGLAAAVRVSGAVDYLPFDLQRTLLRVVQEALANVQRHAMASRVSLVLRQRAGRVLLRVSDNGKGIADATAGGEPQRFGVGIRGMRARLKQFGGELRIKTKSSGTTLIAVVPLTAQGREVKDVVELADSRSHRSNDSSVTAEA